MKIYSTFSIFRKSNLIKLNKCCQVGLAATAFMLSTQESHAQLQWEIGGNYPQSNPAIFGTLDQSSINFQTEGVTRLTLMEHHTRVGLGIETPNNILHIHGSEIAPSGGHGDDIVTEESQSIVQITNTESGSTETDGMFLGMSGNFGFLRTFDKISLEIQNSNAKMQLMGSGRFNFNTPPVMNQLGKFNFHSNYGNGIYIYNPDNVDGFGLRIDGNQTLNNAFMVKLGANARFVVKGDGRTGIGTASPDAAYMLDVAGKIRACEVRVSTAGNWCDYVFEPTYQLMSLGELELYIQKNKHLPEVPTTEQVNEEGIEIAQMNVVLLKKVEELTLYIIQLQKELITAQESLNSAEKGNDQLNERLLLLEKQIELIQQLIAEKTNDTLKK
jgi:hypothetical protein